MPENQSENPNNAPHHSQKSPEHQPMVNMPSFVLGLIGAMWAIHVASVVILSNETMGELRMWFGFIPMRFLEPQLIDGGAWPLIWTGFTHAMLHVGWEHIILNTAWLAIFGTPVAQRYGSKAFFTVFFAGALGGALLLSAHYLSDPTQFLVLIGASGGVAALTGASLRFMFQPLVVATHPETGQRIALGRRTATIKQMFMHKQSAWFAGIWLAMNLAIPLADIFFNMQINIAWEAHIGGFIVGMLLPSLFDKAIFAKRIR